MKKVFILVLSTISLIGSLECQNLTSYNGLFFPGSGNHSDGLPFARLQESYGMRFNSPDTRWVFSSKPSVLIGYQPDGSNWGNDNLLVQGNVGIGTTNPSAKLEISGSGGETENLIVAGRIRSGSGIWLNPTQFLGQYSVTTSGYYNGGWRMFFKNDGNIGIGAVDPEFKLHVDGAIFSNINPIIYRRSTSGSGNPEFIGFTNYGLKVHGDFAISQDPQAISSLSASRPGTTLTINNSGVGPALTIPNGSVAIGTINPGNAKLTVNGKIASTEVVVEINPGQGPDYVFEADYELRTLEETKKYIEQNNHLPEIPSAQEMETEGIGVADMNMRLLKKIEELTLYQIELLELLKKLENELSDLKTQH